MTDLVLSTFLFAIAFWMFYNSAACLLALLLEKITSSRTLFYYTPAWENKFGAFIGIFMYAMWGVLAFVLAKSLMAKDFLIPIATGLVLFVSLKLILRKIYG